MSATLATLPTDRVAMRLIIEARLEGGETSETEATIVAVVERKDRSVADLGLTLAEGRALLAEVRSLLVSEQTAGWLESQLACHRCGSMLAHKDAQSIVLRTVFGKVDVPSPRLRACSCAAKQGQPRRGCGANSAGEREGRPPLWSQRAERTALQIEGAEVSLICTAVRSN